MPALLVARSQARLQAYASRKETAVQMHQMQEKIHDGLAEDEISQERCHARGEALQVRDVCGEGEEAARRQGRHRVPLDDHKMAQEVRLKEFNSFWSSNPNGC